MIGDQECLYSGLSENAAESRDLKALSFITMELMQGYVKEDSAIGVDDLHRWPSSSDAVSFLSETTSAISVDELMKVSQSLVSVAESNSISIHCYNCLGRREFLKD